MCFALPEILRPDNRNLGHWLHSEIREAKAVKESRFGDKQLTLPADNLSTWLSTRYAANQTKKASPSSNVNLDMWLAEKRRKFDHDADAAVSAVKSDVISDTASTAAMSTISRSSEEDGSLSSWLHNKRKVAEEKPAPMDMISDVIEKMSSIATSEASEWLVQSSQGATHHDEGSSYGDHGYSNWLLLSRGSRDAATGDKPSKFPLPEIHGLPVTQWLAQGPNTILDDPMRYMDLEGSSDQAMVRSWLDASVADPATSSEALEEALDVNDGEEEDEDLSQWLVVPSQSTGEEKSKSALSDDQSSILVLDIDTEDEEEHDTSSWRFL